MKTLLFSLLLLLTIPGFARPLDYRGSLLSISMPPGWYVAEENQSSVSFMCDQPKGLVTFTLLTEKADLQNPAILEPLRKTANSDGSKLTGETVTKIAGTPVTCVNFDENGDPGTSFYLNSSSHSYLVLIQGQGKSYNATRAVVWKALNDSLRLK